MKNLEGMSGCESAKHIESIGLDNIKLLTNKDELFARYSDDEIIDELVNNKDRDIRQVIVALFDCCIEPNDDGRNELMSKLDGVLNEVSI